MGSQGEAAMVTLRDGPTASADRPSLPPSHDKLLNLAEDTYVREVTLFDPASSIVKMTSTNMTLSEYLLCKEYITYSSSTPDSTTFRQKATIESSLGGGAEAKGILAKAARKLEESSHERFGSNAAKGKEGMLTVLRSLWGQSAADQEAKM